MTFRVFVVIRIKEKEALVRKAGYSACCIGNEQRFKEIMLVRHRLRTLLLTLLIASLGCGFVAAEELSDVEFYGYKVTHHMGAMVQHIEKFGFNTFDHPPMPDHRFFVITPALDHFYSKAVIDTRWGPVVVDTPARDDRYGSLLVTDMEHFGIYAELTDQKGQRFVIVHEDYAGPVPKGTVIKTKSDFPLVFLRTQSFAFNEDRLDGANEFLVVIQANFFLEINKCPEPFLFD